MAVAPVLHRIAEFAGHAAAGGGGLRGLALAGRGVLAAATELTAQFPWR